MSEVWYIVNVTRLKGATTVRVTRDIGRDAWPEADNERLGETATFYSGNLMANIKAENPGDAISIAWDVAKVELDKLDEKNQKRYGKLWSTDP